MRCPRDNNQLNRTMNERLFGNGCHHCEGIFLAGNRTKAYQQNIEKQLLENTDNKINSDHSHLTCPDCNNVMNVTFVDNIEIDICPKCLGVWFDKTEAKAIINKYQNEDSIAFNNTNPAPFPSEFVHLLSKWFLNRTTRHLKS